MGKPIIGLSASRINQTESTIEVGVPENYVRAIRLAGGIPVVIPLGLDETDLRLLLNRAEAVLFTGGGDIHPQKYHSGSEELVKSVDPDRDDLELSLMKEAVYRKMPVLGICRGLQLINVAMGGTLYEDLHEQFSQEIQHQSPPEKGRNFRAHPVTLQPGSKLNRITGKTLLKVNSLHHQGIRQMAGGLSATAEAPDGLIEGIELIDYPFGVAVQWHPENMLEEAPMRGLFETFVDAANRYRSKPPSGE